MAAITPDGRQELVALFLTMFGRAPTTAELAGMVTAREDGATVFEVAATLSTSPDFALVASQDAETFASYLTGELLAADIPAGALAWATDWVITQVSGTKSKAQVIAEAVQAIRATENTNYASSQAELTTDVTEALLVIDNPIPGQLNFSLTNDIDTFTGGIGDDVVTGLIGNLADGDVIKLGAGNDVIKLTGNGASGIAEVDSANIEVRLIADSTLDATLFTNVDKMSITSSSITGNNLIVDNAGFGTTFEIAAAGKNNNLTVNFLDASGTADTAKLAFSGAGGVKVAGLPTDAAVNISNGATVEAATIVTTGTNYVDLTGGTGAKNAGLATITITGDGDNYLDIVSSATSTTIDASEATGLLDLDIGTGLSDGDVLKAGSGTSDKLTANVNSTASNAPTISGFETLALTLSSPVNMNLANVTDVTTITLAESDANQRLSNVSASVTSISLQEAGDSTNDVRIDYAKNAEATLALAFAPTKLGTTAVEFGAVKLSNVADLTLSASGSYASKIASVDGGAALEALTVKTSAATGDLTVTAAIDADNLVSLVVAAVAGDVNLNAITTDEGALESITITASDEADVTVGALTVHDGSDSSLNAITIKGGDESKITVGAIDAVGDGKGSGEDIAIDITLGEDSDGSQIGAISAYGVASINITLEENAEGSKIGLVGVTDGDVGDITVTVEDDAELAWTGVDSDGDIGDVTLTSVGSGEITVTEIKAAGDIGNITTSSGTDSGEITLVASADSIGDVTITSKADDSITVTAGDTIGDITATVTSGDQLTLVVDADDTGNIKVTGAGTVNLSVTADSTGDITVSSTSTSATGSVINLSAVQSAGAVSITTGAGADTITGTSGGDSINVGTDTEVDTVVYVNSGDSHSVVLASAVSGTVTINDSFDIISGIGDGDHIDVSAVNSDDIDVITTLLTSTADGTDAALVRGKYDATAGTWVAGSTDSTYNDYMLQYVDGSGNNIESILLINIVGTVTMTDAAGVYTINVA